jgi:hypothetical protein
MKILCLLLLISTLSFSDIKYKKGWNLLGGAISLKNVGREEIWTFVNDNWIIRPNKVEKHQGFWFNAVTSGTLTTYEHYFDEYLPSSYTLYSLYVQYPDLDKEVMYEEKEVKNSYIRIKKDLSFEEYITIQIDENKTIKQSFTGKFRPLSDNTDLIVEEDDKTGLLFVSSIILKSNVLIIIRHESSSTNGKIDKKYTYIRR